MEKRIINDEIEKYSVFDHKTDSLVQSYGQRLATMGLQAFGVPWQLTTGVTSFGGATESAFKEGATYGEAGASGLVTAGADILTEMLFHVHICKRVGVEVFFFDIGLHNVFQYQRAFGWQHGFKRDVCPVIPWTLLGRKQLAINENGFTPQQF